MTVTIKNRMHLNAAVERIKPRRMVLEAPLVNVVVKVQVVADSSGFRNGRTTVRLTSGCAAGACGQCYTAPSLNLLT